MSTYMHIYIYRYNVQNFSNDGIKTNMHTHIHMYIYMDMCNYIHAYVYMYVYMRIYICICVYMLTIHMYTRILSSLKDRIPLSTCGPGRSACFRSSSMASRLPAPQAASKGVKPRSWVACCYRNMLICKCMYAMYTYNTCMCVHTYMCAYMCIVHTQINM